MKSFQQMMNPYTIEQQDVLFSTVLASFMRPRYSFDPTNAEHRKALKTFREKGKWPILFCVEFPSVTVPHTCERKLLDYMLKDE